MSGNANHEPCSEVETVRAALTTPSLCTASTVATLKYLLGQSPVHPDRPEPATVASKRGKARATTGSTKPTAATVKQPPKARATRAKKPPPPSEQVPVFAVPAQDAPSPALAPKHKQKLALDVVNLALKSLSDASRLAATKTSPPSNAAPAPAPAPSPAPAPAPASASCRKPQTLTTRTSRPLTELRNQSAPARDATPATKSALPSSTECVAECAHFAFSYLRNLSANSTPPSNLLMGMLALIGKLVVLRFEALALRELCMLKGCLESHGLSSPVEPDPQESTASVLTGKITYASLLCLQLDSIPRDLLPMVAQYQAYVLKMIAFNRRSSVIEPALQFLDPNNPHSPSAIVLEGVKSGEAAAKAAKQLDSIARLLLSICSNPPTSANGKSKLCCSPDAAFSLQIFSLQIHKQWWGLAGHQPDIERELYEPLSRYVDAFRRESALPSSETYTLTRSLLGRLVSMQKPLRLPHAPSTALYTLWRSLALMAQSNSSTEDALTFTDSFADACANQSNNRLRQACCMLKAIALRLEDTERDLRQLVQSLKEIESLLKNPSPSDVFTGFLLAELAGLRKIAVRLFTQQESLDASRSNTNSRLALCEVIFVCAKLLLLALGHEGIKMQRNDQMEQSNPEAIKDVVPSINSCLIACKFILRSAKEQLDMVPPTLLDCCTLAHIEGTPGSQSSIINISNMYSLCGQNLTSGSLEQLDCLQRSVDLLSGSSIKDKTDGFLFHKLERLGNALMALAKQTEALSAFSAALAIQLSSGILSDLQSSASVNSLSVVLKEQDKFKPLVRILRGFHQTALESKHPTCFYDAENLEKEQRAVLLEAQIPLFEESLQTNSHRDTLRKCFRLLFRSVLDAYSNIRSEIHLAAVYTRVLDLDGDDANNLFDQDLIHEAQHFRLNRCSAESPGIESFAPYIEACLTAAQVLHYSDPSPVDLTKVLNLLRPIITTPTTWPSLKERVDDVEGLILRLGAIDHVFSLKGELESCAEVLLLIVGIHQLRQPVDAPTYVWDLSRLAALYLQMGYSGRASAVMNRAKDLISQHSVPGETTIRFLLVKAELALLKDEIAVADTASSEIEEHLQSLASVQAIEWSTMQRLHADVALLCSMLNQQKGNLVEALVYAKRCLTINGQIMKRLNFMRLPDSSKRADSAASFKGLSEKLKSLSLTATSGTLDARKMEPHDMGIVSLAPAVLKALTHLHHLYTHFGQRQEAEYYAGQARKVANRMGSTNASLQASTLELRFACTLKKEEKALDVLELSENLQTKDCIDLVELYLSVGDIHVISQSWSDANEAYERADALAARLSAQAFPEEFFTITRPEEKSLPTARTKSIAKNSGRGKPAPAPKPPPKRQAPKASVLKASKVQTQPTTGDISITNLRSIILTQRALLAVCQGERDVAMQLLEEASSLPCASQQKTSQYIANARLLMLKSTEEAAEDFTFNVLPESTISFPSLLSIARRKSTHGALESSPVVSGLLRGSQASKGLSSKTSGRGGQGTHAFAASLAEARDRVVALQSEAFFMAAIPVCHQICELAMQTTVLLSAIDNDYSKPKLHPTRAALSMELPRIEALRRELSSIEIDRTPMSTAQPAPGFSTEMSLSAVDFQQDYIDILPKSWSALSMRLSEDCSELYIVRYEAERTPFILRLPMTRHKLQDMDEPTDEFDFEAGHEELREIVEMSNYSCHNTPDLSKKGAKTEWWAEREALDSRMHELLLNIENIWLGGFKGVLSQHHRDGGLLARFRKSFENILDRHLPSRQGVKPRQKKLALDSDVLELFIGLGDDQEGLIDLDEQLLDLLYFVIDVLQFNGERNAYDEVDFDAMATETLDALRSYHDLAESSNESNSSGGGHLILILDKRLHDFPWENLPCLEKTSVSRVSSMLSLRERILAMRRQQKDGETDQHVVPRTSGTYILNPAGDLASTQATFEPLLGSLLKNNTTNSTPSKWDAIVGRIPDEKDFSTALTESRMLLYFGHGSGNQYIRNRSIKKLRKCAEVTWLMGCSSGAVAQNGDFEPTSVPLSYLVAGEHRRLHHPTNAQDTIAGNDKGDDAEVEDAGVTRDERQGLCMAVLATLWDVTDKDIDRFSVRVGEEWGLWSTLPSVSPSSSSSASALDAESSTAAAPPKTPAKRGRAATATATKTPSKTPARSKSKNAASRSKSRVRGDAAAASKAKKSLVQAVVEAREECHLRYLNGAATVVYGIPVYLGD